MTKSQISLKTGILNPALWSDVDQNRPFPIQQHPCYGLALQNFGASPTQITIYNGSEIIGRGLLMQRRFLGVIKMATLFRGPVWTKPDIPTDLEVDVYRFLKKQFNPWRWQFLSIMPEKAASEIANKQMQQAGLKRVISGFTTIWHDLQEDEEDLRAKLKGKWRNQLVKAEKNKLDISVGGKKPHHYEWLLERETEQRKKRSYDGLPVGMVPHYAMFANTKTGAGILSVSAIHNKQRIAGALFLLHGNSATYHIGWVGEEGRSLYAQNLVLWEAMLSLKQTGIRFLDLGGLNTADMAGIARFKLGLGSDPITLAGSYI